MNVVWRCAVCHRKKELNGKHLENKTQVRSDCWPCGKKQTFVRESNDSALTSNNESIALNTSNIVANDDAAAVPCHSVATPKPALPIESNQNACTIITSADKNENIKACIGDSENRIVGISGNDNKNKKNSNNNNNNGNTFSQYPFSTSFANSAKMSEQEKSAKFALKAKNEITSAFQTAFNIHNTRPQSALEAKCKSPFIVQTTAGTSPPFTFKAAPMFPYTMPPEQNNEENNTKMSDSRSNTHRNPEQLQISSSSSSQSETVTTSLPWSSLSKPAAMEVHQQSANTNPTRTVLLDYSPLHNTLAEKEVWKCVVCGKVKDLHGEHLRNKTSVRSDCWPCGKKQTFVLSAARSSSLNKEDNYAQGQRSTSLTVVNASNTSSSVKNGASLRQSAENSDKAQTVLHEENKRKEIEQQELERTKNANEKNVKCNANMTCLPDSEKTLVARSFVQPIIPPSVNVDDYFIQPISASLSLSSASCALTHLTLPHSTSAETERNSANCSTKYIDYYLFTRSFLTHLRTLSFIWPPRRCVWHEASNTLYVLLTEKELNSSSDGNDDIYNDDVVSCKETNDSKFGEHGAKPRQQQNVVKKEGSVEMIQVSSKNGFSVFTNTAHVTQNTNDAEILGKYAAHLFAIEQMIVQSSPFKRVTHWFCDSELSFAACCCYASQTCPDIPSNCPCNHNCKIHSTNKHFNECYSNELCKDTNENFNNDSNTGISTSCNCQTYCSIYGPVPDPTRERTAFGNIIVNASASHFLCNSLSSHHYLPSVRVFPTIVSEEQRIAAAQEFYRRTSWLTLPMYMNGMAIHLKESVMNKSNNKISNNSNGQSKSKNKNTNNEENVSVVLVAATMKLEELTQAATWTLPPTPEREGEPTSTDSRKKSERIVFVR